MNPEVSVVIVTHNSPAWVERCLRALLDEARPVASFEVVVVDSGSEQTTRDLLQRWADRLILRLSVDNIGFAAGCNWGVQLTSGTDVLLLNPDAVVHPGCVDALVGALEMDPGAGIVGGRTLRPDGTVDPSSCWGAPTLWSWFCFATGLSSVFRRSRVFDPESLGRWERDSPRRVDIVTGCLLMTRRSTWDRLGGFDLDYFMYGEDADLSLRAAQLGMHPAITPDAVAIHAAGASSGQGSDKVRRLMTAKATLARKRWSPARARAGVLLLLAGVGLRALAERLVGRREPVWLPVWADRGWARGWGSASIVPRA
ncbi:MAG TPA: glycosyltransferase family 2 protein [Cellulomonas sp.]|uniref:glycosyltransferase family 2 protein n=1 Tax=Cellulomonas sp. TaxID=40001 RepID=UPI002E35018B|nr:glycosyltransferase family 2 protein [Cellulomonas sp.]HEX5333034.1 glycosyltransferase family 2 protein [Cellulomonas sp.]